MARLRVRVHLDAGGHVGPGRADLLAHIATHGSIAAAGRAMGMSYRRAWELVEALNDAFNAPLVQTAHGGARGGGASLTPLGEEVLQRYRAIVDAATQATTANLVALQALAPPPARKPD
ncbi:winged helix-turn-helix domain-containing protein [Gemmatimonas sp.]|uniref:winged helix-turn-helix domain-containing protein n=1 Tax=Gemmatimonas sp. TaxID=1962908 RepID=UPI0037BF0C09